MLSQSLALPRMRTTKNRELFLLKRKQEIEEEALMQSIHKQEKEENELIRSYYLKVLNKIKRTQKGLNTPEDNGVNPLIDPNKYHIEGFHEIRRKSENRPKSLPFQHKTSQAKPQRLERVEKHKRLHNNIKAVVRNGSLHDESSPEKERKRDENPLLLRRMRMRNNLTMRIIEMKSSRSREKNKSYTIDDNDFERSIQRTKYTSKRPNEKMDDFDSMGNATLRPVQSGKVASYQRQQCQQISDGDSLDDLEYENNKKKYKDITDVRNSEIANEKTKQLKRSMHLAQRKISNTFDLTGW